MILLAIAVAVAAAALAGLRQTTWKPAARWIALAVVGQAATVQLIRAGRAIGYEHVAPPWEWARLEVVAGLLILGQAGAVLAGLRRWRNPWPGLDLLRGWRGLALLAVFLVTSSALSPAPVRFGIEIVVRSLIQAVAVGNALLIAAALPRERWLADPPALWPYALGAAVTVVSAVLAVTSYQRHPHIPDEVAYLIQAKYFAAGRLSLVAPAVPSAFNVDLLFYQPDRIFSVFPPGWPAVLAIGVAVGAAWLINPLLAGLNVVLCHRFLKATVDAPTATLGTILLACSPWHLFLGMSLMSHSLTLALGLGAGCLVVTALGTGRLVPLVGAGLLIGAVGLIRPLDGLVVAMTLGLVVVLAGGTLVQRALRGGVLATATAVAALVVRPYNAALTGHGTVFPVMLYFDRYYGPGSNDMGFGPNRGVGWSGIDPFAGHGARDVVVNSLINLFQVNTELLGWATGSLVVVLLALGWRRATWSGPLLAMALAIVTVVALHAFYWFSGGPDFGARYWFLAIVPAMALAARGLTRLDESTGERGPGLGRAAVTALVLSASTLTTFVPWRATDKYWHYRGMVGGLESLARTRDFGKSLVLVQGRRAPDYHGAAVLNPVDLEGADGPIYAWDRDEAVRRALLDHYRDRPVWVVTGPTLTGGGYQVSAGPLTTAEASRLPAPPRYPTPPGPNP